MPTPTKGPRLGGSPAHERLILANLATALFEHGRITTTETKAKRLRGTALDPFGRTSARRFERELRDAYRTRLLVFAAEMNGEADDVAKQKLLSDATALAALADSVRGYEDVKERSAAPLLAALGMTAEGWPEKPE